MRDGQEHALACIGHGPGGRIFQPTTQPTKLDASHDFRELWHSPRGVVSRLKPIPASERIQDSVSIIAGIHEPTVGVGENEGIR